MLVIQRRCGERTEDQYLSSYGDQNKIYTVTGEDLFSTTKKGLYIANKLFIDEWTLFVDADMRLYTGAVEYIQKILNELEDKYYNVGFALDDRFLRKPIFGVHALRNKYIEKTYNWFVSNGVNGLKAESSNIKSFCKSQGLITKKVDTVVGSHDFGQYYSDLYWKFIVRGVRRYNLIDETIEIYKKRCITSNTEDCIIMEGLRKAKEYKDLDICKRNICDPAEMYDKFGITEKSEMHTSKEVEDVRNLRCSKVFGF